MHAVDSLMQKDPFGENVIKLEFTIRISDSSNYVNSFLKRLVCTVVYIDAVRVSYLNVLKPENAIIVIVKVILDLAIYGRENILRFAKKVGFAIARKQAELMKLVRRYRKS